MIDQLERSLQQERQGQQALLVDLDALRKEIAARQRKPDHELVLKDVAPAQIGLPVGSNFIAFVVDTSGSMRNPFTGRMLEGVIRTIETVLESYPNVQGIQLLDGDGQFVLGRRGSGTSGWLEDTPQVRAEIKRALRNYDQDSVSDPVPGVRNAIDKLYDRENPAMRMGIFVFGDEFNSSQSPEDVIQQLDKLNPANKAGQRAVTISAIGFPTTKMGKLEMWRTGIRFANLMRTVTYLHGGAFIALQDL
jgi:hypothetical protein